jgi:hypothetical protein
MNVSCVEYRGLWAVALLRQNTLVGYWSVGKREWMPETELADITLWTKRQPAIEYIAENRTRLFSARMIINGAMVESDSTHG